MIASNSPTDGVGSCHVAVLANTTATNVYDHALYTLSDVIGLIGTGGGDPPNHCSLISIDSCLVYKIFKKFQVS